MFDETLSPVLEACSDAELKPLSDFLLKPKTSLLSRDPEYLAHPDRPSLHVGALVREIRLYGGHSIKDRVVDRSGGTGRCWRDIVRDALAELGEKRPPLSIRAMERLVVDRTLDVHFDEFSEATKRKLRRDFYAGAFFAQGLSPRSALDDFQSLQGAADASFERDKVKRVLKEKAKAMVGRQVKDKLVKVGLKLAIRGAAVPGGRRHDGLGVAGTGLPCDCAGHSLRGLPATTPRAPKVGPYPPTRHDNRVKPRGACGVSWPTRRLPPVPRCPTLWADRPRPLGRTRQRARTL